MDCTVEPRTQAKGVVKPETMSGHRHQMLMAGTLKPDTPDLQAPPKPPERPPAVDTEDDEVDEAGEESFPASDPPPWTAGIASKGAISSPSREL